MTDKSVVWPGAAEATATRAARPHHASPHSITAIGKSEEQAKGKTTERGINKARSDRKARRVVRSTRATQYVTQGASRPVRKARGGEGEK